MQTRVTRRGITLVEAAAGFAIVGSILAVAIAAFLRELHASRLVEPVSGLERLGAGAVAYAQGHSVNDAFPASAPLTPSMVPRGKLVADPPGTWDGPTWQALAFPSRPATDGVPRPFTDGAPHAFSFAFDSNLSPTRSTFVAHAHGDLDGDDVTSTFEVRGHVASDDPAGPVIEPGIYVQAEVE
jgi:hypothetical protein